MMLWDEIRDLEEGFKRILKLELSEKKSKLREECHWKVGFRSSKKMQCTNLICWCPDFFLEIPPDLLVHGSHEDWAWSSSSPC